MVSINIKNSYTNYDNHNPDWDKIFEYIDSLKNEGDTKFIKNAILNFDLNINSDILKKKYKSWKEKNICDHIDDNKKNDKRLFSKNEENELYNIIINDYINKNEYLDDDCIKILAEKKWKNSHPNNENFTVSKGWIYYYKLRWKLSSLTAKYTRTTEVDQKEVSKFHTTCKIKCKDVKAEHIFNFDETCWRSIYGNNKVIGKTGSENRPLITNYNTKLSITAGFLVSYANIFHKILLITKGKTKRALEKLSMIDDKDVYKKYTESGWINTPIMMFLLEEIYKITNGSKAVLILDQYKAHIDKEFKKKLVN